MFVAREAAIEAYRIATDTAKEVELMRDALQAKTSLVSRAIGVAMDHPVITSAASVAASIVSVLQSAQSVVSTLVALATSITSLVLAVMAVRGAFKKARKGEE
jgi:ABC-type phosphonate transport system ATPase subunit